MQLGEQQFMLIVIRSYYNSPITTLRSTELRTLHRLSSHYARRSSLFAFYNRYQFASLYSPVSGFLLIFPSFCCKLKACSLAGSIYPHFGIPFKYFYVTVVTCL
jgi:hypothetical protein